MQVKRLLVTGRTMDMYTFHWKTISYLEFVELSQRTAQYYCHNGYDKNVILIAKEANVHITWV